MCFVRYLCPRYKRIDYLLPVSAVWPAYSISTFTYAMEVIVCLFVCLSPSTGQTSENVDEFDEIILGVGCVSSNS